MKLLMVLGAIIGFLTGALLGLAGQGDWASVFWRASVAALAAGVMMRWWGRLWLRSWKAELDERLAATETQRQESKTTLAIK
jgi:hypothetical protein